MSNFTEIKNNACKKRGCHIIVLPMGSTKELFQKELEKNLRELEEESKLAA